MKLRLHHDAIRLRLDPHDIERFLQAGRVEESVTIGPDPAHRLAFALEMNDAIAHPRVSLEHNCLTVAVPRPAAERWARSEQVDLPCAPPAGARPETVRITVEKDLECRHDTPGASGPIARKERSGTRPASGSAQSHRRSVEQMSQENAPDSAI